MWFRIFVANQDEGDEPNNGQNSEEVEHRFPAIKVVEEKTRNKGSEDGSNLTAAKHKRAQLWSLY